MASLDFDAEKLVFHKFYEKNRGDLTAAVGSFETLIRSLLQQLPKIAIANIEGRLKDPEECVSKFTRKYRTKLEADETPYEIRDKITDLIGLRVVCLYEDDVERVRAVIADEIDVLEVTDKTAQVEGTENSFGYKGLHLDLKLNAERQKMAEYRAYADHQFELQIRTVVQDSWSIIDHKIKYKKSIPNSLKRRINTLAALFELADREFREIRDATNDELKQGKEGYKQIEDETPPVGEDAEKVVEAVPPRRNAPLDAFSFLRIAQHFFNDHKFDPRKVDGFTEHVVLLKPDISRGKFNYYLRNSIANVKKYQDEFEKTGRAMNPFTIMRHCLYAGEPVVFETMLTDTARQSFKEWLEQ